MFAELARERRTGELWCSLAAERSAHADGDDREHPAPEAPQQLEVPTAQPDRLGDLAAARTAQSRQKQCADAGERPGAGQHEEISRRRSGGDGGEEMTRGTAPGQSLMAQEALRAAASLRSEGVEVADDDHQAPEARAVAGEDALPGDVRLR